MGQWSANNNAASLPTEDNDQAYHNTDNGSRDKNNKQGTWAQVAQGRTVSSPNGSRDFVPMTAQVQKSGITYSPNHLLGLAQEIRDNITAQLYLSKVVTGGHSMSMYQELQLVCRQLYHETQARWNMQIKVILPANKTGFFLRQILNPTVLHSKAYCKVTSLVLELRHDAPHAFFSQLGQVLKFSTQLQELQLFGVGPDAYGVHTSSIPQGCGKHDNSILPRQKPLHAHGQNWAKRIDLLGQLQWLHYLRVLVIDNMNMPLIRGQVLKYKTMLEKLYIAADPRSVIHHQYLPYSDFLGLGQFLGERYDNPPPIKELRIDSNATLSASRLIEVVAGTLEVLEWVVPDVIFQSHYGKTNYFTEATQILTVFWAEAPQLRELRLCITNPLCEDHVDYGNFMGALTSCISRLGKLEVLEVHIQHWSDYFGLDFMQSIPPSVKRLYLTDLLVKRNLEKLNEWLSQMTLTPIPDEDAPDPEAIGEPVWRNDYYQFNLSNIGFVGYEYDIDLDPRTADRHAQDVVTFLKLNGLMLDKERNRHLASLQGKHTEPIKHDRTKKDTTNNDKSTTITPMSTPTSISSIDTSVSFDTDSKAAVLCFDWLSNVPASFLTDDLEIAVAIYKDIERCDRELAKCHVLNDDNEYFGEEAAAEAVFHSEAAALHRPGSSYPVVVEVENKCTFRNHWLSK
jgi:hypothetical protein